MSDYNKIDGQALDRYITGNYGEDQFKGVKTNPEDLAKEMWDAWIERHKQTYPEIYTGSHPVKPPKWEDMSDKIKLCWIDTAKTLIERYDL